MWNPNNSFASSSNTDSIPYFKDDTLSFDTNPSQPYYMHQSNQQHLASSSSTEPITSTVGVNSNSNAGLDYGSFVMDTSAVVNGELIYTGHDATNGNSQETRPTTSTASSSSANSASVGESNSSSASILVGRNMYHNGHDPTSDYNLQQFNSNNDVNWSVCVANSYNDTDEANNVYANNHGIPIYIYIYIYIYVCTS